MAGLLQEATKAAGAGMGAGLQAAVGQLSAEQQYTFTLYKRMILPADGYVFWCLASAVTPPVTGKRCKITVGGSLHVTQTIEQQPDSNVARQTAVFTVKEEIRDLAEMAPDLMYLMSLPTGGLIAFSVQTNRYQQADIWHYSGKALLPYEATQIINDPAQLDAADVIVSNSMPIWLGMSTPELPIYPADLSPMNLVPPYITADITQTQAVGAMPLQIIDSSQSQLAQERVLFTLWGCRNSAALDFQLSVLQNSLADDSPYGVMNLMVPTDEKATQSEFGIIAQKKTMPLELNYYQSRTRDIARKLILSAFVTITAEE